MTEKSYKAKLQPGREDGEFIARVLTDKETDMSDEAIEVSLKDGTTRTVRLGPRMWTGPNTRGKGQIGIYKFFFIGHIENKKGGDDF